MGIVYFLALDVVGVMLIPKCTRSWLEVELQRIYILIIWKFRFIAGLAYRILKAKGESN